MTPTLIAYVLSLPLPVRLALLDADPTGPGWHVDRYGPSLYQNVDTYDDSELRLNTLTNGYVAWLPCNPLAIAEHAARLHRHPCWTKVEQVYDEWWFELRVIIDSSDIQAIAGAKDKCPHTAAVRMLAEVVGG